MSEDSQKPLTVIETLTSTSTETANSNANSNATSTETVTPQPIRPAKSIYALTAPRYLQKGISVIPLRPQTKIPLPKDWQTWADQSIPDKLAMDWLSLPSNNNIGLVLGKQSNVVVVDIDSNDELLIKNIENILPKAHWIRVGKKGVVLAYKYNPAITNKFHLYVDNPNFDPNKPEDKKDNPPSMQLVDFLTSGAQVVLPPSIHPETKLPYYANCDLVDVIDKLEVIPSDIYSILVNAIEASGYTIYRRKSGNRFSVPIPLGQRDTELTSKAGVLALEVIMGRITLKQAFDLMDGMFQNFVEKIQGDDIDIEKHKNNIVKFIFDDMETRNKVLPLGWDADLDPSFVASLGLTSEQTEASYEEITREAKLRIEEGDSDNVYKTINWVIDKLTHRQKPEAIREQQLLEFLAERAKQIAKSSIKVGDLKRDLKEKRKEKQQTITLEGEKLDLNSHTAVARAAINDLNKITPIITENKIMYKWTGSHWKVYEIDHVKQYLATRYADIEITRRNSDFEGIFKQMLVLTNGQLKKTKMSFINLSNGLLLEDGTLINHDPDYGATYILPYSYRPELADIHSHAPLFSKYLNDAWSRFFDFDQRLRALQEIICASCLGIATQFQRAVLLFGAAGSGKSVLLKIIAAMFPEEAKSSVSFDKLHDTSHVTMLNNKIINIVGELSNSRLIEGSIFKMVIAGERTTGRYLFNEAFNLVPKAAHWAASNHLPKSTDTSKGFVRRWLIFSFENEKAENEVIVDLDQQIINQELESIFAWAIQSRPRIIGKDAKLTIPDSCNRLQEDIHIAINPVKHFLMKDNKLVFDQTYQVAEYELFMRFRQFMVQTSGIKKLMDMAEFSLTVNELAKQWQIKTFKSEDSITWYSGLKVAD